MNVPDCSKRLLVRIRLLIWLFIIGLVISGATAIPLQTELNWMVRALDAHEMAAASNPPGWAVWLVKIQTALNATGESFPFLFYGTDWLAFGHFVIAIAFVGALRDPIRNRWLFTFGMISCVLVIPYAFAAGAVRGIPVWWRLVDCSFGVIGFLPLWFCARWTRALENCRSDSFQGSERI